MSHNIHVAKHRLINSREALNVASTSLQRALDVIDKIDATSAGKAPVYSDAPIAPNGVIVKDKVFEFQNAYDANAFYDLHVSGTGSYKTQLIHIIKEG